MTDITTSHADQIAADADAAISAGVKSYEDVEDFIREDNPRWYVAPRWDVDD